MTQSTVKQKQRIHFLFNTILKKQPTRGQRNNSFFSMIPDEKIQPKLPGHTVLFPVPPCTTMFIPSVFYHTGITAYYLFSPLNLLDTVYLHPLSFFVCPMHHIRV